MGNANYGSRLKAQEVDAALAANTRTFTATAANTFAAGEIGYISAAGTVTKAINNTEAGATSFRLVMAAEAVAGGASGLFYVAGGTQAGAGLTPGDVYYIGATAGAKITTAPTAGGTYVRKIGIVLANGDLLFDPDHDWITN